MTTATIFVSNVQKELAEERRVVKAFVEGDPLLRRFFTVFLFEDLPAADARTDAVYLDEVDCSALYVGLFGSENGFEDAEGVSPTEREFNRATERSTPRLIFVKGTDDRARHPKMAALVHGAGNELIRQRFRDISELPAARVRRTPEVTPEVAPEVTPEVTPEVRLVRALRREMTRHELREALRLRDDKHFRQAFLYPAIEAGLVEMTIPDKPRSSKQKYRRTAKGTAAARGKK